MRVLWICNLVLPEFADEYGIKRTSFGGWMSGMLCALSGESDVKIGLCFPIIDERRMKNGVLGKIMYYSFHAAMNKREYRSDDSDEFIEILHDFNPDIVHIWGTEYNHSRAMMEACSKFGIVKNVLVHIQGLVSYYALHYILGIEHDYLSIKTTKHPSILDGQNAFVQRGENEHMTLKMAHHVCDSSEWGGICVRLISPTVKYYYCHDILRKNFYRTKHKWNINKCRRYSIFVSQASYPIKGVHFLLRAMAIIKKFYPETTLSIGGENIMEPKDGEISGYARYLRDIMIEYGLEDDVRFLGILAEEEMIQHYLSANVFVSPSTIEDPSNSVCEAMILGTPVVASYVGGTVDIVEHSVTGFLYPCDAYYVMASYIMKIFSDDETANRISKAARKTAIERHDPVKLKTRMVEIYREVAAS